MDHRGRATQSLRRGASAVKSPVGKSTQAGFVTLAAIVIIVVVGLVGTLLYTSLLGEVQGEIGSRQSVAALAVAEAGANWAGNKLQAAGSSTYAGDTGQTVLGADGVQVGVFDVVVTCTDGSAVSTGCSAQPASRRIASTGYVPNKILALGKRAIQMVVADASFSSINFAICGYNSVTLQPNTTTAGNVGSEGAANPDMTIKGQVVAGGGEPGNVSTVTSPDCGGCPGQVSGSVNPNQAAGTVCPNKANVLSSYTCTPGTTDWSGGALTVNSGNASWRNITLSKDTVTFDTTGLSGPLVVQVNSISATGPNNTVLIKGGGKVQLIAKSTISFGPSTVFGQDFTTGNPVNADQMVVESCSSTGSDIFFGPKGSISAVFIDPNGGIQLNPSNVLQGSVLASDIQMQPQTGYAFDPSAGNVAFGSGKFSKVNSWEDVP
jgi:hypothetical protein